ncbi:MAG TPA: Na+/H+ antiporter subunit E [Burkholderiaceae bacterium]|jgi:multicomponent K+:H+ antiporter subunit E|nr:Na+/H+ antiporter subunit E [Burkholderiaceae bacterium]
MKRLISWLYLPTLLLGLWLLLNDSISPGNIALGGALALFFGWASQALRPLRARPRHPIVALKLIWRVAVDVFNSNLEVARIIWVGRSNISPGFIKIPITMTDPHGLAALSCIVTYTPGTVWAELAEHPEQSLLTLHVLDLKDEAYWIHKIQYDYERPLKEIFES